MIHNKKEVEDLYIKNMIEVVQPGATIEQARPGFPKPTLEAAVKAIIEYADTCIKECNDQSLVLIKAVEKFAEDNKIDISTFDFTDMPKITVTVEGGIAYCDSRFVEIVDRDNEKHL